MSQSLIEHALYPHNATAHVEAHGIEGYKPRATMEEIMAVGLMAAVAKPVILKLKELQNAE